MNFIIIDFQSSGDAVNSSKGAGEGKIHPFGSSAGTVRAGVRNKGSMKVFL